MFNPINCRFFEYYIVILFNDICMYVHTYILLHYQYDVAAFYYFYYHNMI